MSPDAHQRRSAAALLLAAVGLTFGAAQLFQAEQNLQRATRLTEALATALAPAEDRSWEAWQEPWLTQWLRVHNLEPANPHAVNAIVAEHLTRYASISTHENVVRQGRIQQEDQRVRQDLERYLSPEDTTALLLDLHNAWGRHFQGLEVTLPQPPAPGG